MTKTTTIQDAAPSEELGPRFNDFVVGRVYKCGVRKFTIREVARYFGNWQVCFYDSFDQKEKYEHIGSFRKMLQTQTVPE